MTMNMEMRRGDLKPDLIVDLDMAGVAIPTTLASSVWVVAQQNGVLLFRRAATSDVDGVVTMEWQITDTDNPGTITLEVEIIWPGAKPQTVRPDNVVKVLPDLG